MDKADRIYVKSLHDYVRALHEWARGVDAHVPRPTGLDIPTFEELLRGHTDESTVEIAAHWAGLDPPLQPRLQREPLAIMYHGTTEEAAEGILRDGFQSGTYFARHLEDALHMGGRFIFEVLFEEDPTSYWQYVCREPVARERIVCAYTLAPEVRYESAQARRRIVELQIRAEHGDARIICANCDGRGEMEDYPPFTPRSERSCTVCEVCNGRGDVPADPKDTDA